MDRKKWILIIFILAVFSGCATGPRVAINRKFDFSKIQRVAVVTFAGPVGEAAADFLAQELLSAGVQVVERQRIEVLMKEEKLTIDGFLDPDTVKKIGKKLGIDAVFIGTISGFAPSQSYVVSTRESSLGLPIPIGGKTAYSTGIVPGVPDSAVVTSTTYIDVAARMVDIETGALLWAASMNYEGTNVSSVLQDIAIDFVKSLKQVWINLLK